ncbi:hypothetical protein ACH5RR_018199 [Cinchona calisaya]|uniref:Uncharacterized protein n=1 Tax=Cinchona calisaya TaxID=153742 RepID=A0ABD2ZPE1_9GENT
MHNSLSGSIPVQILNISTLQRFLLVDNNLSGNLPPTVGNGLIELKELFLYVNDFHGVITASICNASKLTILDLTLNKLSGPVPNSLGDLRLLTRLSVAENDLRSEPSSTELTFINCLTNYTTGRMRFKNN